MQTLLSTMLPQILDALAAILSVLLAAVLLAARQYLTAKVGATTTQALADMLHRALETGAQAAYAANPQAKPGDMIRDAISHAEASIPDTLAKLAPKPDALANIARAKVAKVLAGIGR